LYREFSFFFSLRSSPFHRSELIDGVIDLLSETKQRTLEELDQIFSVPTGVFAKYQLTKALPYFFKRWVFLRRNARLEPLYKVEIEKKKDTSAHED
jgi:hypothetical protein